MQITSKLGLNVIEQTDKILNSVTALGNNANIIDNAIATSISSSSTNSEIAGAKAVYDFINKSRGAWHLENNFTITPVSSFTQIPIKLVEDITPDSSYLTYNTTTGLFTFNRTGKYRVKVTTQLRGSSNNTTTTFVMKGFGISEYDGSTWGGIPYNVSETTTLTEWATLFGEATINVTSVGYQLTAAAYSKIQSGTATYNTVVQGSNRTAVQIEFLEDLPATLNSLNTPQTRSAEPIEENREEEIPEEIPEGSGDAR